jgi:hypothetical protein
MSQLSRIDAQVVKSSMNIGNVVEETLNYRQMNAVRRTHVCRDRCGEPSARATLVAIEPADLTQGMQKDRANRTDRTDR